MIGPADGLGAASERENAATERLGAFPGHSGETRVLTQALSLARQGAVETADSLPDGGASHLLAWAFWCDSEEGGIVECLTAWERARVRERSEGVLAMALSLRATP